MNPLSCKGFPCYHPSNSPLDSHWTGFDNSGVDSDLRKSPDKDMTSLIHYPQTVKSEITGSYQQSVDYVVEVSFGLIFFRITFTVAVNCGSSSIFSLIRAIPL